MLLFDLAAVDRSVQSIAEALRRRDRALAEGAYVEGEDVTFDRQTSSRATVVALDEIPSDPFVTALRAWVVHLTIERVTSPDVVAAWRARETPLEVELLLGTAAEDATVRGLVNSLATGSDREARHAAKLLEASSIEPRDAARRLAERRAEAARLLSGHAPVERRTELARAVLSTTQPAFDATRPSGDWIDVVRGGLALDATEGWPAHLTPRWLLELFGPSELLRGVRLEPGALPRPVAAASFCRALGQVGGALAWADRGPGTPYCLSRCPQDPLIAERSALLASLFLEPAFLSRKLGLGKERARAQARALARAGLIWIRLAALRILARPLLLEPAGARDFEDVSELALGRPMPGGLLGVVPRSFHDGGDGALEAILAALAARDDLRERFDEDWFDNPRAHEQLRHEHQVPVSARRSASVAGAGGGGIEPEKAQTAAGLGALVARIRELVGND